MRKILILSLLLSLVPVSAEAVDSVFLKNIIRAHGWKCDYINGSVYIITSRSARGRSAEITCDNGKVFYYIDLPLTDEKRSISICHKGKCKKIN